MPDTPLTTAERKALFEAGRATGTVEGWADYTPAEQRHDDEYDALARQLHENIAEGQTVSDTAKALRLLTGGSPTMPDTLSRKEIEAIRARDTASYLSSEVDPDHTPPYLMNDEGHSYTLADRRALLAHIDALTAAVEAAHRKAHPTHPELEMCEYKDCRFAWFRA
jgi:hypothetical protein